MKREVIRTEDGSTTIRLPDWDECYHSMHGAIQEARHVFIRNGLQLFAGKPASILEIGFGTGLNALITCLERKSVPTHYTGIEGFPVLAGEIGAMNYPEMIADPDARPIFDAMHSGDWEIPLAVTPDFVLTKCKLDFAEIDFSAAFDLVYFDAFGYPVQPELWSVEIFAAMWRALRPGGVLVTYAARSVIRRNMQACGFVVEKLPGPPGKREMMRARKI